MRKKFMLLVIFSLLIFESALACPMQDSYGRIVDKPHGITRFICSGPGCLRLATYLQAHNRVIAVDDIEGKRPAFDARPYALANPQFAKLPTFGQFRGADNPELILSLAKQPQIIFKTFPTMGYNPDELQNKTKIPVFTLDVGDLDKNREKFYNSLRLMGLILDKQLRAEDVIAFFEKHRQNLNERTANINQIKSSYIGGVAFKGARGLTATEPSYPPFNLVNAKNVALQQDLTSQELSHATIGKETLLLWDPEYIFIDLSSLQLGKNSGGLYELTHDSTYKSMQALQKNNVYGVLPYNWYAGNYGSILANAYFIGKQLYPEAFADIDPIKMANDIYTFLVGKPVFDEMNKAFDNKVFTNIKGF